MRARFHIDAETGGPHLWRHGVSLARQNSEHTHSYQLAASEAREAASEAEVAKLELEKAKAHQKQALTKVEELEESLIAKKALSEKLASRREI